MSANAPRAEDGDPLDFIAETHVLTPEGELLKPYIPRLLIEWVRDVPENAHHAREGSLAFVDISGFTALTERLSKRGKIGAELLRDTLDAVFKSLLDEAYGWGAGLLKWGGDALLLLFDGPGHPERAVRAVWELQQTIERVGRIRISGGAATLRMSVGVATGTVEFFTAGSVHRELLIAGPTATETVLMEAAAAPGEIALSPALARLLDPSCVGPEQGEALLLVAPPATERWQAPDLGSVDDLDIGLCIPLAGREHVLLERSEPEHRMITATFFELMRTDALLEELGPAAFAKALDERIRVIQETAAHYEVPFNVSDVSKGAIKVLLSAGAPSTTGHDEEQTLRLVREVMDAPGVIPMRVGINSGRAFTGDFGPPYRRTYAVLGDAVNTAARVMARAGAGQVLATQQVLDRSRTLFRVTPIEPFQAKGKAEPVRASLVGPIAGRRDERISETPFVGRDRELETLRAVLDDVKASNGWTVEIGGPSGIGKTRLVREVLAAVPDVRILHSVCEEYEASTPYYPLRAPVRDVLGLARDAAPEEAEHRLREVVAADGDLVPWIPLLGILLGLDLPATPETAALDERFLREVLADVAHRFLLATVIGPLALVVEDAQFIDDSSADLLHRLAAAGESLPRLIVLVRTHAERIWTDTEAGGRRCLAFYLLPLSERQAASIVEIVTDEDPLRPDDVEQLARRSGGSPLFLVELMNVVRSSGTTESLPDSLEAVVAADIDRLAPRDRIVLRYASVLGVTFREDLLKTTLREEVTVEEGLWERLKGLVDHDSDGLLRFRNTLVRDAAYEGLPFRRRRELHARVAEAVEGSGASLEDEAATLALHFAAARSHVKTWEYARLGGDRARAVAANVEAARLYELALSAAPFVRSVARRDRAEVLIALGTVRETAGLFDQSYVALRSATRLLADDPVGRARVYARRALARMLVGAPQLALRETAAGLRLVEALDSKEATRARAELRSMRAQIREVQGHPREAIALAVVAMDEARRSDVPEALGRAYGVLDEAYQNLGEPEKVVHGRLALELYRKLGHTRRVGLVEMNLGHQAQWAGRWDEAIDLLRRAQSDCSAAGDRQAAAGAGVVLGEVFVNRRAFEEAASVLRDARRVLRATGVIPFALLAEAQLARIDLEQGRPAEALVALTQVLDEMVDVDQAGFALEVGIHFASAAGAAGRPGHGLEVLDELAEKAGEEAGLAAVPVARVRGALLAALGRLDEAWECLEGALAGARRQSLLYEQLLTLRQRFELSRARGHEPSREELREADRLAQLLGIHV